jgi:methylenetetrahydrofolate dehydrogenase (NADP+)/methenyltetrahydrofolate cyclohydrolase
MATLLSGTDVAARICAQVKGAVLELAAHGCIPGLAVLRAGDDPASLLYLSRIRKIASQVGIRLLEVKLPADTPDPRVRSELDRLNADESIHGILVQMPLPEHLEADHVLAALNPEKDADGVHPMNVGRLCLGQAEIYPCTPSGVLQLLDSIPYDIRGKRAVVVGRSSVVGGPIAILLLQRHATLTVCHTKTLDLAAEVSRADLLIAAAGSPGVIKGEWIKPGAVVVDVGVNRLENKVVGDVEFEKASERASFLTPVPGGVGPLTTAMLMSNVVYLAKKFLNQGSPQIPSHPANQP